MVTPVQYLIGFVPNLLITLIIVRFIYYPNSGEKHLAFTLVAFNSVIFFVMTILMPVNLSIGTGFGLFALLSLLRYRSEAISARDMTYLIVLIGLPLVNSVPLVTGSGTLTLLTGDACIIVLLFIMEKGWLFPRKKAAKLQSRRITYKVGKLYKSQNEALLLADLRKKMGLDVVRVEYGRVSLAKNVAELTVYHKGPLPQDDGTEEPDDEDEHQS
jgi:hypothetical protein